MLPVNVFPLGTHVYREPHVDMDELMSDLPLLKKLGFNMIKIQEVWDVDEPVEGQIDLSRIERIIARAGDLGLGIYLGLTMECAPAWLWRKHPDCRYVYPNGQPHEDPTQYVLPGDGKPGPCYDHPGARSDAQRFLAELVRRLGRYENIWTWNTWQEVGIWSTKPGEIGVCYCPHTLAAFRDWIRQKYSTLTCLNDTWKTGYGDWEEVEPPRCYAAVPITIDWHYFMETIHISRNLEWKTRTIRENDPHHRPVFCHPGSPIVGRVADFHWAKIGDFYGSSNYPAWYPYNVHQWDDYKDRRSERNITRYNENWYFLQMLTDILRCICGRGKPVWGAEFQGGPIGSEMFPGRIPSKEDIRLWMYAGLAAGMTGISFWNHRPEIFWGECNGFGILDQTGETTERAEEISLIGRVLNEEAELFAHGEVPQPQVAILFNSDLFNFCQATRQNAINHLQFTIIGHYYRLWRMGVFVDFLTEEDVAAGKLNDYRAAILPFPVALAPTYFSLLKEYVANGGMLISDACPGRYDKYGLCPRSQMVDGGEEVFGVRHKSLRVVREPDDGKSRWTPEERGWGELAPATVLQGVGDFAGSQIRASYYLQTLLPTTAQPILMAGDHVAGTINRYGDGYAVLLGTLGGHGALAHRLSKPEGFFERLMALAKVKPELCGQLIRRRRVAGGKQAWFLINPTESEVEERIPLDGFRLRRDVAGDILVNTTSDSVMVRVPVMSIGCLVVEAVMSI